MLGSVASWGAVPIFSKLPVSNYLSESLMALTVTSKTMESGTGKEGRKEGRKEKGVAPLLKSRDPHWE